MWRTGAARGGALHVNRLDGAKLERPFVGEKAPHLLRHFLEHVGRQLTDVGETFGPRHPRHLGLVLEALLGHLERRRHVEDRLAVLDRDDAAVAETLAVARELDLVDDRCADVARHEEVRVQRVHVPILNGVARGRQRLTEHLAAEDTRPAQIAALAAEDPILDALEREQLEKIGEDRAHDRYFLSLRFKRAMRLEVSQRLPPMPTTSA